MPLWVGLWILGFSLNALMLSRGMALHGSSTSSLILALDVILSAICLIIWRRWFPQRYAEQSWRLSRLDYMLGLIAPLATALYLSLLLGKAWGWS